MLFSGWRRSTLVGEFWEEKGVHLAEIVFEIDEFLVEVVQSLVLLLEEILHFEACYDTVIV